MAPVSIPMGVGPVIIPGGAFQGFSGATLTASAASAIRTPDSTSSQAAQARAVSEDKPESVNDFVARALGKDPSQLKFVQRRGPIPARGVLGGNAKRELPFWLLGLGEDASAGEVAGAVAGHLGDDDDGSGSGSSDSARKRELPFWLLGLGEDASAGEVAGAVAGHLGDDDDGSGSGSSDSARKRKWPYNTVYECGLEEIGNCPGSGY